MNIDHSNIIKACLNGERKAQRQLFTAFNKKLFAVSMIYMNDRHKAEEVLQESWIDIFNSLDRYQERGTLMAWMKTILIRKAWKAIKREKKFVDLDSIVEESNNWQEEQLLNRMSCEEILGLLEEIPNGSREVFKMYVIDGFKHEEIGEILQISKGTSRVHLSRARKMLKIKFDSLNKVYS